jgi:molybdopterin converting factor small subunit
VIVRLLLFAGAREAAGTGKAEFEVDDGASLERLLADAVARFGDPFARVLGTARVWVNGDEPAGGPTAELHADDEIAVLPPVSGGSDPPCGVPGDSGLALLASEDWCASPSSVLRSSGEPASQLPRPRC